MGPPQLVGQPSGGLSDDLDPADDRGLDELVVGEGGAAPGGLLLDALDRLQDVEEALAVAPQTVTASASTR